MPLAGLIFGRTLVVESLLVFLPLVNLAVVHEVLNYQAVLHVDAVKIVALDVA